MRNLVYFGYGNWMNDSVCDIESLAPEWTKWFLCLFVSHVYRPYIEWLLFQGGLSDWQYIEWTLEQLGCVS